MDNWVSLKELQEKCLPVMRQFETELIQRYKESGVRYISKDDAWKFQARIILGLMLEQPPHRQQVFYVITL